MWAVCKREYCEVCKEPICIPLMLLPGVVTLLEQLTSLVGVNGVSLANNHGKFLGRESRRLEPKSRRTVSSKET